MHLDRNTSKIRLCRESLTLWQKITSSGLEYFWRCSACGYHRPVHRFPSLYLYVTPTTQSALGRVPWYLGVAWCSSHRTVLLIPRPFHLVLRLIQRVYEYFRYDLPQADKLEAQLKRVYAKNWRDETPRFS